MKAFPLIYSRILKDDYPNGFLTRPADLDVSIASKYVIPAMENIRHVGGIRHAVFSAGDYLIYGGVACVTDKLVKRILRSRTIDFPYKGEKMEDTVITQITSIITFADKFVDELSEDLKKINALTDDLTRQAMENTQRAVQNLPTGAAKEALISGANPALMTKKYN